MKRIMIALVCLWCIFSCKKNEDDLSGTTDLSGKLYIENIYEYQSPTLLADQNVFLLKDTSSSATSYMLNTRTDKDGYFLFKYLYDTKPYRLHCEKRITTTQNSNILYTADSLLLAPRQNIKIYLRPDFKKQNGLHILCMDTLIVPGRMPGVKMYIYTSRVLANLDSAAVSGAGASDTLISQANGTAFTMNLPTDSLFINASITVGATTLKCRVKGLKTVYLNSPPTFDTIQLRK